jgi:cell fate regulator YaaT (PSP1 superfamily)
MAARECVDKSMSEELREEKVAEAEIAPETATFYRVFFREEGQHFTAFTEIPDCPPGAVVMVRTDHGLEPATIAGPAPICCCRGETRRAHYVIERLATVEEREKYAGMAASEHRAMQFCDRLIASHHLAMNLVRVERYFHGGKMIFYFTAENRVDFRGLVKDLVQEFRTRVEMRQVGVRHETKMIGGIGTCGRELCCSSFIRNFDSVSIKMAKEQDLPLNPTKISGVCNRLLCCLTYEYETYRTLRKNMPKSGKRIKIEGEEYLVKRQNPLQETIVAENSGGEEMILSKRQWKAFQPLKKEVIDKKRERRSGEPPGAPSPAAERHDQATPPTPEADKKP